MSAVAGSLSVTGSTFQANQAFVRQADANAYGYEQANAEVDATAGGGGVDHGNAYYNTVTTRAVRSGGMSMLVLALTGWATKRTSTMPPQTRMRTEMTALHTRRPTSMPTAAG